MDVWHMYCVSSTCLMFICCVFGVCNICMVHVSILLYMCGACVVLCNLCGLRVVYV